MGLQCLAHGCAVHAHGSAAGISQATHRQQRPHACCLLLQHGIHRQCHGRALQGLPVQHPAIARLLHIVNEWLQHRCVNRQILHCLPQTVLQYIGRGQGLLAAALRGIAGQKARGRFKPSDHTLIGQGAQHARRSLGLLQGGLRIRR